MKQVILSFTGCLRELSNEFLTRESLNSALFFFGCTRDHAKNPGKDGATDEREWFSGGMEYHKVLVSALLKAEAEGRCVWREAGYTDTKTLYHFQAVLRSHGIPCDSLMYPSSIQNYPSMAEELNSEEVDCVY